jgi:predicted nuclease with TOPRIM domain
MKWLKKIFSIQALNLKIAQLKTELKQVHMDEARWRKERNEFQAKYLALRETLKRIEDDKL